MTGKGRRRIVLSLPPVIIDIEQGNKFAGRLGIPCSGGMAVIAAIGGKIIADRVDMLDVLGGG